jgi:hypothetical protein
MMFAYTNIGQLGIIRYEIVRILKEWQEGRFDPDMTPLMQEASWAPRFQPVAAEGVEVFPVALGATQESAGESQGPVLPKPRRRILGIKISPRLKG